MNKKELKKHLKKYQKMIKEFVIDTLDRNRLTKSIIVFCYEFYIWVIKKPMLEHTGMYFAGVEVPVLVNPKKWKGNKYSSHVIAYMECIEPVPIWHSYNGKKEIKRKYAILGNKEIGLYTNYKPLWFITFLKNKIYLKNKFNNLLRSKK